MLFAVQGGSSAMVDAAAIAAGPALQLPPGCYPVSSLAASFMSGLLSHLPGLLPFTAPSTNSYERLQPCCWSGKMFIQYRITRCKTSCSCLCFSSYFAQLTGMHVVRHTRQAQMHTRSKLPALDWFEVLSGMWGDLKLLLLLVCSQACYDFARKPQLHCQDG